MEAEEPVSDRVSKKRKLPESPETILVTSSGKVKVYESYALAVLKKSGKVEIVAKGKEIAKAVSLAEVIKRSFPSVKQTNSLVPIKQKKQVPEMKIVLESAKK